MALVADFTIMAYSQQVIDHYENPKNVGSFDKTDPDIGTGMVGAPACGDAWDDLKIPFSQTAKAQRYIDADAMLAKNPQVTNLVGHSLGGASILELQKNHPETKFRTNTYGAPAGSIQAPDNIDNHRYRNDLDPVSMFDGGAESNYKASAAKTMAYAIFSGNPENIVNGILDAHSYDNFDKNKVSDKAYTAQPMV